MTYIDMNMVRAGVVDHPVEWRWGGYGEIQNPPRRYARIGCELLCRLLCLGDQAALAKLRKESVLQALAQDCAAFKQRCADWTESIAVGSLSYTTEVQSRLGIAVRNRSVEESGGDGVYLLREQDSTYRANSDPENGVLSAQNTLP
jgi:hypothetical protein